ncbi:DUF488 domain-containing protein [bacterium M00.F.Ca.ET.228.01.1.1]|uniref:DUF488 domain-containing protein n=1 Tax=Paraburkholderia phenoliruptrix TaxID=252970 RepID=UPI00109198BD|nr:DUF488 domain-containing protein [Paraburkholderia phenoliruptrix]TGP44781.1 DUF488 domain-containing protein [bacterium M00.F.Ca.ET.228.01.1.1]TGS02664.1 DUF488 domain-containing protein [bacterium M00.F.Ca.ET.191.01.1.1]TGU06046.1 DUF488 domain-containing protein [bacterium M00.F.Ca.ET.155.01.1.1]MBW0450653.1 DUF488 domain-containing protein [Paraburkholderia phenoliruptrix]MBW9098135.1 DUF488 domain-containing protein [Paraburkholderia phenoliruptrix]
MTVYTIGYEGLDIDGFTSLLAEYGIDTVVDIRELPLSRKRGFSKKALAGVLNLSGLEYVHMADLGCPKQVRDRYREDGNWKRYTEGFLKHLKRQKVAIAELSELAGSSTCALLCYEADFNFCHRSMVANAVRDHCGADVAHIKAADARTISLASLRLAFA